MTNTHSNQGQAKKRSITKAKPGDKCLGPLSDLPGTWSNSQNLAGSGWNLIALPSAAAPLKYRVLMNQYNEVLKFTELDAPVPNRGIPAGHDQCIATLDYQQTIKQLAAADYPESGKAGEPDLPIHHEPGLFLHMLNHSTDQLDIARLATIPHGDSVLALGRSVKSKGPPIVPVVSALPIGAGSSQRGHYLEPYQHFTDHPFRGTVQANDFPGFQPRDVTHLLRQANKEVQIARTTRLTFDSTLETGGIVNIPFIQKQANAASMKSTFWIQELRQENDDAQPTLRLQYLQVVILDFFERLDGLPGLMRWPHVSINTMQKVEEPAPEDCEADGG